MEQTKNEINDTILEKIAIMIDIMIEITNCSYSDAYEVIANSETFKHLHRLDYATSYDSPQANLASIGEELRSANNRLGGLITDDSIKEAMSRMREKCISERGK